MIKTIAFDLGDVVVSGFADAFIEHCSRKLGISKNELLPLIQKYEPDLQSGKYDHVTFWKYVLAELSTEFPEEVISRLWYDPYVEHVNIDPAMLAFVDSLRKHYIVGCISNAQEPHNQINRENGLLAHFSPLIISSEVGMRKPDREIFDHYLQLAGCKPHEMVFIDDRDENMAEARKMGIHCILFTDIRQLKAELQKLGIIT